MVGHNGEHGPTHVAKSGAEVRRAEIAQRYLRGETTIREFAAEYGVSTTTIESDLQILRRRWLESQVNGFDEAVAIQLTKLDQLEAAAWDGWQRSCQPKTKTVMHQGKDGDKRGTKAFTERDGNPRFLEEIQRCLVQRARLLGLNAPVKIAPTDPTGTQPYYAGAMERLRAMDLSIQQLDAL